MELCELMLSLLHLAFAATNGTDYTQLLMQACSFRCIRAQAPLHSHAGSAAFVCRFRTVRMQAP